MVKVGTPGTYLELQAAADIWLTDIEVYSVADVKKPFKTIQPRQLKGIKMNRICLWLKDDNHCLALCDDSRPPIMDNALEIFKAQ